MLENSREPNMSKNAPVFVIASNMDHKTMNHFFLDVYDWEFGSGARFGMVDTKNAYEIEDRFSSNTEDPELPGYYTGENFSSPWAGASLQDIEAFCIDAAKTSERKEPYLFLVLDDQDIQDETVILLQRQMNDACELKDSFDKVRMPWQSVYSMWCNLDIANMNFEEFCEGNEADEAGWWEANEFGKTIGDEMSAENREKKEAERHRLHNEDKI